MGYFVILEQKGGVVKRASLDVWNRVQQFARTSGEKSIHGLIIGGEGVERSVADCRGDGCILVVVEPELEHYMPSAYTDIIAGHIRDCGSDHVFIANTAMGKDLAPRIAMRLGAGHASDCMVDVGKDKVPGASTTVYSGKVSALVKVLTRKAVYSLGPIADRPSVPSGDGVEVKMVESKVLQPSAWNPYLKEIVYLKGRKDITEADIVVAGGRGVGGAEHFALLESLADALGGTVGASRSAVDEGWRPHFDQIGQTGRSVAPKLYIACGISGAAQHLAGIVAAETIVAINRDSEAPIFKAADYGIVGDVQEVVPRLEHAVREIVRVK